MPQHGGLTPIAPGLAPVVWMVLQRFPGVPGNRGAAVGTVGVAEWLVEADVPVEEVGLYSSQRGFATPEGFLDS